MKVLLTGGAGFIGQHVVRELLSRGQRSGCWIRCAPTSIRPCGGQPQRDLLKADVRDASALDRALPGVEAVIHLAAKVGLGVDVGDMPDYASSNDAGTAELLAGMARAGVLRLTLASSMVVYGEGFGQCAEHGAVPPAPRNENDLAAGHFEPPCPICGTPLETGLVDESDAARPAQRLCQQQGGAGVLCSNWARVTGGSVAAMRYHNVYGPGMPRDTPYAGVAAIFTSALRAARPRRCSRTAASGAISCMCATLRRRQCWPASGTWPAFAPSTSARARRARSATWQQRWRSAQWARACRHRPISARRRAPHHGGFIATTS